MELKPLLCVVVSTSIGCEHIKNNLVNVSVDYVVAGKQNMSIFVSIEHC